VPRENSGICWQLMLIMYTGADADDDDDDDDDVVLRCWMTRRRYLSSRCGDYSSTRRKPRSLGSSSDDRPALRTRTLSCSCVK